MNNKWNLMEVRSVIEVAEVTILVAGALPAGYGTAQLIGRELIKRWKD